MVPGDAVVYNMTEGAYVLYRRRWFAHGEVRTDGYYRWKRGRVTQVVQAEEMEDECEFEAGPPDEEVCFVCETAQGVQRCCVCEGVAFCAEHASPDESKCAACWEQEAGEEDEEDIGSEEDEQWVDRHAFIGQDVAVDSDEALYYWACAGCGLQRHSERTLCSSCKRSRPLASSSEEDQEERQADMEEEGDSREDKKRGKQLVVQVSKGGMNAWCLVCLEWAGSMTMCLLCKSACCTNHYDGHSGCCEVCSEEIAEYMKEAVCSECGVCDKSEEEGDKGRLHLCEWCMYAFCVRDGEAYEKECYRCEKERAEREDSEQDRVEGALRAGLACSRLG
jgi:hypothetical protein